MKAVGIIPARAGSRRLPGKNLAPLAGEPLIAHTCRAALESGVFAAVYVNTDSPAIAAEAQRRGVACPALRPSELATDDAPTRDANRFLLELLAARGERGDAVVVLQPTSPLRTADDIRAAWALFQEYAPCAVVSVSPVAPADWLGHVGPDARFEPLPAGRTVFRLNGAIYVYGWDDYVTRRDPARTLAYCMPARRGIDIDTQEDLDYADFVMHHDAPPRLRPDARAGC